MPKTILVPIERRRTPRQNVDDDALTFVEGHSTAIPCEVRDISDGGARIALKTSWVMPKRFKLYIPDKRVWQDCEQVWRKGNEIGLGFLSGTD